jgi:hypothetical protein
MIFQANFEVFSRTPYVRRGYSGYLWTEFVSFPLYPANHFYNRLSGFVFFSMLGSFLSLWKFSSPSCFGKELELEDDLHSAMG